MEIWKNVVGYEGLYMVSNLGNVKAMYRESLQKGRWGSALVRFPERDMKLVKSPTGYLYLGLSKNGITTKHLVHRLVLQAFVGASNLQCNHIDGNKENNNIQNLEYCTSAQNLHHCINVLGKKRGEGTKASKLTESEVREIRSDKRILKEIARDYRVTLQAIHMIKARKNWKHVK